MDYFITIATNVVIASLVMIAGWVLGNYVYKLIQNIKKLDDTLKSFLGASAKYAILALAAVMVLQQFGVQTASLLAVLGAAGLAIGLALQGTLSNVSAGVMLLILRPFDVGDFISAGGTTGTVKSLGLFATELSTLENVYIFVPNSNLWNTDIQNFSRNDTRRQDIVFGISYNDDINKAFKTIEKAVSKDDRIFTDEDQAPQIMVTNLGDSSVDITLRIWSDRGNVAALKVDTMKAVKEALDKDGISIPFPTRTIEMTQPANETVKTAPKSKTATKKKAA
ncbi:MAG: mechanosensitive ion channel family protein [Alphaproteobacteria bacterium]